MKVVFVAGFFTPVLERLKKEFADQIKSGNVVWIRQSGPDGGVNVKEFRERFHERLAVGAQEILVLLAVLKGKEHAVEAINGVIAAGVRKWPGATVNVEKFSNAGGRDEIATRIAAFDFSEPHVSLRQLRSKIAGRILCVRETNHTPFQRAFERAGFSQEIVWEDFFDEVDIAYGEVNNLVQWLKKKSKGYSCILYAWHGLKYMGGNELDCTLHQAGDCRRALDRFKQWVTGADPGPDDNERLERDEQTQE